MSALEEIVTKAAQSLMDAYRQGVIDGKTEGYDEGYRKGYETGRGIAAWSNLKSQPLRSGDCPANYWQPGLGPCICRGSKHQQNQVGESE